MFKHLMNGGSIKSLMLYDKDGDGADAKAALRAQLTKDVNVTSRSEHEKEEEKDEQNPDDKSDNEGDDDDKDDKEEDEEGEKDEGEKVEETEEEKTTREAKEKEVAKATRKQDRMQRRIDEAIAAKKAAETEIANLKAQLAADPDKTLTEEEVEARAEAKAKSKLAAKQLEDMQSKFQNDCDTLQSAAKKLDKEFDDKIEDIAAQLGPIPSFMIGVLSDMDNGGEVLAFVANDEEVAEGIWNKSPATMTRKLVEISNKLIEAKKKPKKQISKVPDPVEPVKGTRVVSTAITEADAKNMDVYVAKRRAQILERRKAQGF